MIIFRVEFTHEIKGILIVNKFKYDANWGLNNSSHFTIKYAND